MVKIMASKIIQLIILLLVFSMTRYSAMDFISINGDTTNGFGIFSLNGGPCGLLEHDAISSSTSKVSFSEFSRQGVECESSTEANYKSSGWTGNGVINYDKYLYFSIGSFLGENIILLRKNDKVSLKAKRTGTGPDTLAAYYVERFGTHTLIFKTHLTEEMQTYYGDLPETSIPVISNIRFYAWGSEQMSGATIPGWLTVDDVQITFAFTSTDVTSIEEENNISQQFSLQQNYPNPFNPSTTIEFTIPTEDHVKLSIYDILGKEVKIIVNQNLSAGKHSLLVDVSGLTTGIYFYRLQAGSINLVKKLSLLK